MGDISKIDLSLEYIKESNSLSGNLLMKQLLFTIALSKSLVDARVKPVIRGLTDIDGEQEVALSSEPPALSKADAVVSDGGEGLLDRIGGEVAYRVVKGLQVFIDRVDLSLEAVAIA